MKYPSKDIPVITEYRGLKILRGDQISGGLKRPVLERVLKNINADTIVYPADGYGSAGEALALACKTVGKRLHLLLPDKPIPKSKTFQRSVVGDHVTFEVVEKTQQQIELVLAAQAWANEHQGFTLPIGCATPEFQNELTEYIRQIWHKNRLSEDIETWYAAGSGTLGRSLKSAFPALKLGIANLCFSQLDLNGYEVQVLNISNNKKTDPGFATNPDYDGPMWGTVPEKASPGSLVINYAG